MNNSKKIMPVLFIGHGSPMNALATNDYTRSLNEVRHTFEKPKAILCISAHWLTKGTFITSLDTQKMTYDFSGFAKEMYEVRYPVRGSAEIARQIQKLVPTEIKPDHGEWGLDHGVWSVLRHLFPEADVPVLQLSIDINQAPEYHFKLGQELFCLRDEGILIVGSGNIAHNLTAFSWNEKAPAYDWAVEFDSWVKQQLLVRNYTALVQDFNKTPAGKMSVPSLDHYLPLLYILGASRPDDKLRFIYEKIENASIAMRSLILESYHNFTE